MPKFGEPLSKQQFRQIMRLIEEKHRWSRLQGHMIKYVTPTLDLRDGKVFHVEFRGFCGEKVFDFRDNDRPMFSNIMAWLEEDRSA